MAEHVPQPRKPAAGLYTIIAIKLAKGLLLFGLAVGIYSLLGDDLRAGLGRFLRWVRLDPEREFFVTLGEKLEQITPSNIRWIASGTLLYSLLLFVESTGLMWRAWWAGWLAIGETAFFIPIEVYKLVQRPSRTVLVILVINVLIVLYLVRNRHRLFKHHHHHPRKAELHLPDE